MPAGRSGAWTSAGTIRVVGIPGLPGSKSVMSQNAEVEMQNESGEIKTFRVSNIEDGKLTVDGNHPMAGQTITFSVTVVDIGVVGCEPNGGVSVTRYVPGKRFVNAYSPAAFVVVESGPSS